MDMPPGTVSEAFWRYPLLVCDSPPHVFIKLPRGKSLRSPYSTEWNCSSLPCLQTLFRNDEKLMSHGHALTNLGEPKVHQGRNLSQLSSQASYSDGAVVGWTARIPSLHESPSSKGKSVSAVGVSNLQNGTGNTLPFSYQEREALVFVLNNRE